MKIFTLDGCGSLERTLDFQPFLPSEDVVVLKGMFFNNLHFGRMWWS